MINIRNKAQNGLGEIIVPNRINNGTTFIGDIESDTDLRIDGVVIGNISSTAKVVIGESGDCKGDIVCMELCVSGKVNGILEINGLFCLKKTAIFEGDVYYEKLIVEEGATVMGSLTTRPLKKLSSQIAMLEAENA